MPKNQGYPFNNLILTISIEGGRPHMIPLTLQAHGIPMEYTITGLPPQQAMAHMHLQMQA